MLIFGVLPREYYFGLELVTVYGLFYMLPTLNVSGGGMLISSIDSLLISTSENICCYCPAAIP